MQHPLECLSKCKSDPVVKLDKNTSSNQVRELLLSRTAVAPGVPVENITKAIDELIELKYPLINRILEVAAYCCKTGSLHIYFINDRQLESSGDKHTNGHYNKTSGLIVIAGHCDITQTLIHELTHAVRDCIKGTNEIANLHWRFCKNKFSLNAFKANESSQQEQNELTETKCFNRVQRHRLTAQELLRTQFYGFFKPYDQSEYAEEFLPFFLGQFVSLSKEPEVYTDLCDNFLQTNRRHVMLSILLNRMYCSLPSKILDDFIKGDLRLAIELYLDNKMTFVLKLEDSPFYLSSNEPTRINNSYKHYALPPTPSTHCG